jgi:hypothetical protein
LEISSFIYFRIIDDKITAPASKEISSEGEGESPDIQMTNPYATTPAPTEQSTTLSPSQVTEITSSQNSELFSSTIM